MDPIATSVHGDYVDPAVGVATTLGTVPFDEAPTETRVTSRVQDLVDFGARAHRPCGNGTDFAHRSDSAQPVIRLEGCRLDDVRIDDFRLKITLADEFFSECDTLRQARRQACGRDACRSRRNPAAGGQQCHVGDQFSDRERHGEVHHRDRRSNGMGSRIPRRRFTGTWSGFPNFGKIYFGEMFVTDHSRRLTMVRFQLGSDDGGEVSAAGGETNGGTSLRPRMRLAALALILLCGCSPTGTQSLDTMFERARGELRAGELAKAQLSAEQGLSAAESRHDAFFQWKFRLLRAEILLNSKRAEDVVAQLGESVPQGPQFAPLAARKLMLQGQAAFVLGHPDQSACPARRARHAWRKRRKREKYCWTSKIFRASRP